MTQYSATVWPAMIYPGATNPTANGGTATAPIMPPNVSPLAAATQAINWTAPAAVNGTVSTSYVTWNTIQDRINTLFGITPPATIPPVANS